MKQCLFVLFFAVMGVSTQAQKINWISFNDAITAQKKNPKPIFIDVYTNWCPPCKMLDKNTFADRQVVDYINANYYAVKFNAEGNESITFGEKTFANRNYDAARANSRNGTHEFTNHLEIRAYPSMIVIEANKKISKNILGYRTAEQLLVELK
ncbi:thioredoxin family protein [Flavobacterium sp. NKUCC04_CG]|uniref:thioredoxin family protein n=1 Tax=Flavobacterium sp. NKUCC04_CG TaxID=2842121 RepID=UPI001C5A8E89|nr:thioredoxin family protein [Flavobacterium sp. NKUCC04_CG]MBW3519204.1 thioredoxin family protein [Flavobacterium sp. NKUCC04_CG]